GGRIDRSGHAGTGPRHRAPGRGRGGLRAREGRAGWGAGADRGARARHDQLPDRCGVCPRRNGGSRPAGIPGPAAGPEGPGPGPPGRRGPGPPPPPPPSGASPGRGLKGTVAVVTGASSGIGWALAKDLAAAGCPVGLMARREGPLNELAAAIRAAGRVAAVAVADVADRVQTELAVASLHTQLGP